MDEASFLARIRTRLGRMAGEPPSEREHIGAKGLLTASPMGGGDLVALFVERLTRVGGTAEAYPGLASLHRALETILDRVAPQKIGMWGGDTLQDFALAEVLRGRPVVRWGEDPREAFHDIEVGITGCLMAVADTGTLVLASGPYEGREVHLLPRVHVALVRQAEIRARLGAALPRGSDVPSALHFVSGPSGTADIAEEYANGVHGPGEVDVLVLGRKVG